MAVATSRSPEYRARISRALTGRKFSDSHRANLSAAKKGKPLPASTRAAADVSFSGRKHSEATIAKMSESRKRLLMERPELLEEASERVRGIKNPMWSGGRKPYPAEFTEKLKQKIRDKYEGRCQGEDCGRHRRPGEKKHHVHHKDGNKKNCSEDNLIPLCVSCHNKETAKERLARKKAA